VGGGERAVRVCTWTEDQALGELNATLGYVMRSVCTRLRAELPLR
jgi:hypothetical protein